MPEVKGRIRFRKLIVDGQCLYDLFCEQIRGEGNLSKQLNSIVAIMDQIANGKLLPGNKFKQLRTKGEYEIKTRDLRVYLIKEEGHIVILGGKKGTQDADIRRFKSLREQYLNSKL